MDQEIPFMSSMAYLVKILNIEKIHTVGAYNHQSLQAEYCMKSLATILTKYLINLGNLWPNFFYVQQHCFMIF